MDEKLLSPGFAGVNMQFENWVKSNYPDIYDEWLAVIEEREDSSVEKDPLENRLRALGYVE